MRNKKGISLIVLVITIIVMIILAASVVLTLSNTGIINNANEAVNKTNKKQIEQLASLAWSEAFMDGARTQEALQDAVDLALKDIDTSDYTVIVTEDGVTVNTKENGESKLWYDGWEVAYAYADGNWQSIAANEFLGIENITKDEAAKMMEGIQIFARFYKTGEIIEESGGIPGGDAYKFVVSGNGAIGKLAEVSSLSGDTNNYYAWVKELFSFAKGETEVLPKILYTTQIEIEEGITSISTLAFPTTINCKSIKIPSSVELIEEYAILETAGTINVVSGNQNYASSEGILYNKAMTRIISAPTTITTVNIPNTVIEIDHMAFSNCDKLTSVVVPKNVGELKDETFNACDSLTRATILCPKVSGIPFYNCDALTTVTFSKNVKEISTSMFAGCDNIRTVYYEGTEAEWANLDISRTSELASATVVYNCAI